MVKQEESWVQKETGKKTKLAGLNVHGATVFSNGSDKPAKYSWVKNCNKAVYFIEQEDLLNYNITEVQGFHMMIMKTWKHFESSERWQNRND